MADDLKQLQEKISALEEKVAALGVMAQKNAVIDDDIGIGTYRVPEIKSIKKSQYNINLLIKVLLEHKGSDLHIKEGVPANIRVGGEMVPVGNEPLTANDVAAILVPCLDDMTRSRLQKYHEVDFAYETKDARFRVNMFLSQGKLGAALRYLTLKIPTLDELGLPPILKDVSLLHNGLIIITGPAGNGKSTTLAAIIEHINSHKRARIVTLEEPIEFVHKDNLSFISQREVGYDTASFFEGLRMALRQDPNVILIGEMRDNETIMAAIEAAETGHLVLSTLHTPNAIQSISRIIDALPEKHEQQYRVILSNVLRCVVSQRLVSKRMSHERVAAVEVMIPTSTIKSLIFEGNLSDIYPLMQQGKQEGMQTFTQSLVKLYNDGVITAQDAMYHADQPTEFKLDIEGHQTSTVMQTEGALIDWM